MRLLLGRGGFRKVLRFRLLLCRYRFRGKKQKGTESQGPGAITHSAMLARAQHRAPMKMPTRHLKVNLPPCSRCSQAHNPYSNRNCDQECAPKDGIVNMPIPSSNTARFVRKPIHCDAYENPGIRDSAHDEDNQAEWNTFHNPHDFEPLHSSPTRFLEKHPLFR